MYKTVRHGENSLQYTILPQNDDFRIEGKLSSAGSNCTAAAAAAAAGRKGKARRPKRRSFFAYLGLIFVCTVIVGAILIPFLVSAECLPNPTEWFLKTKSALTHNSNTNGVHRNGGASRVLPRKGAAAEHVGVMPHITQHSSVASIGQKVEIINHDGVEKNILRANKTQTQLADDGPNVRPLGYVSDKEEHPPAEKSSAPNTASEANLPPEQQTNLDGGQEVQKPAFATLVPQLMDSMSDTHNSVNAAVAGAGAAAPQQASNDANNFVTEVRFESGASNTLAGMTPSIVVTTVGSPSLAAADNQQMVGNNNAMLSNNQVQVPTRPVKSGPATVIRPTTYFSTTSIYSPHAPAGVSTASGSAGVAVAGAASLNLNSNQNISAPAIPTITTRIMQLPLLKSAAKKPLMPPVLIRTNSEIITPQQAKNNEVSDEGYASNGELGLARPPNMDSVDLANAKKADWIQSHWPYIDPSTYFQWTAYKEDSVLLPALLGFALTGVILIIAICLVARNKRAIISSVRKRNRNDVEEGGADDNATLLTNANLSDED